MAEELQDSIDRGDLNRVKELFNKHGSKLCNLYIQWDQQRRESPIHRAINQDQTEIALYLLQLRKSQVSMMIKHADFRGETALHRCGWCGRVSIARKLIKLGAKLNAQNTLGLTPLHLAAEREKIEVVELFIRHKANVNAQSNQGNTPLHRAMTTHNEAVITALIRAGADPEVLNHKGNRAGGQYTAAQLLQFQSSRKQSLPKIAELSKDRSVGGSSHRSKDRSRESKKPKQKPSVSKSKEQRGQVDKDRLNTPSFSGLSQRSTSSASNSTSTNKQTADVVSITHGYSHGPGESYYEIMPEKVKFGMKLGEGDEKSEGDGGNVFEGTVAGQTVALKNLQLDFTRPQTLETFRHELDVLCSLRHSNVLPTLGAVLLPPDRASLVMELCRGGSLQHLLSQRALSLAEVIIVGKQVAIAMHWLHTRSPPVLHLNLKPGNVLFSDLHSLHVKVADFGISRELTSSWNSRGGASASSRRYMAPEMLRKLANMSGVNGSTVHSQPHINHSIGSSVCSEKSDVYSFGMLLWEMYTRQRPFEQFKSLKNQNEKKAFYEAVWTGVRPPIPLNGPPLFANLIHRSWATDTSVRPCFKEVILWLDRLTSATTFTDSSAQVFWDLAAAADTSSSSDVMHIRWKVLKATLTHILGDNEMQMNFLNQLGVLLCHSEPFSVHRIIPITGITKHSGNDISLSAPPPVSVAASELVTIERFGSFVHCFAPYFPVEEFMQRAKSLIDTRFRSVPKTNTEQSNESAAPAASSGVKDGLTSDSEPTAFVYYPFMEAEVAVELLANQPDGTFLLRNSIVNSDHSPFIVSHVLDGQVKHTTISFNAFAKQFSINHQLTSHVGQLVGAFLLSPDTLDLLSLKNSLPSEIASAYLNRRL